METPTVPAAGLVTPSSRVVASLRTPLTSSTCTPRFPSTTPTPSCQNVSSSNRNPPLFRNRSSSVSTTNSRQSSRSTPTGWKIAQAYAGHQFGGFSAQLGDGRAILLGEVIDTNGARHDLQLKGSGRTPFSRGGDGKSALGPVIREYIVSEAMAALGVLDARCGDEHSRR